MTLTPKESSPGKEQSSFGIELRNPDATYALLLHGVKAQKVFLNDNWEKDIYSANYDLISHFDTLAISQLRINQDPSWTDRNTKNLELHQLIRLANKEFDVTYWKNNIDALATNLTEMGVPATIAELAFVDDYDPDADRRDGLRCIVMNKEDYVVIISYLKPDDTAPFGTLLLDLHEIRDGIAANPLMGDYAQFLTTTSVFLQTSKETISAMYKMAGKQLPDAKITLWPESPNQKEVQYVAMICGSCRGGYPEGQITETKAGLLLGNPTCPNCGATNPQIKDMSKTIHL